MKKSCIAMVLTMMLSLMASGVMAAPSNPLEQLTGTVWAQSSKEVKDALIFGVECAITVEYIVAQQALQEDSKKYKNAKVTKDMVMKELSPFARNWILAFDNVPLSTIVGDVDQWYKNNPDQEQKAVFEVLWKEVMTPRIAR